MQAKETIIQAMRHHENGELDEAEKLYARLLQTKYTTREFCEFSSNIKETRKPEEAARIANDGLQKADNNS